MNDYNKGIAQTAVLLIVLGVVVVAGIAYYIGKNNAGQTVDNFTFTPPVELNHNTPVDATQNQQVQNSPAPTDSSIKTYSNTVYGFSFQYPSTWKLEENLMKKSVTLTSDANSGSNYPDNNPSGFMPIEKITFTATDKSFFNSNRVSTKYGIITYDENQKALFSDYCLKASKLFGGIDGNISIQVVPFGGSLMSDPAYGDSAILTTSGEIIIVYTEQGAALTPLILKQMALIGNSFKLLEGNTVFVPSCAQS
jgi:hypothetical protein